jgi:hypothetical protein
LNHAIDRRRTDSRAHWYAASLTHRSRLDSIVRMSNALWVYCRTKPDLPPTGELHSPVHFTVRPATPSDDALLVGGDHKGITGGAVRIRPGEMAWVVEFDFPATLDFESFVSGGIVVAGRSGGGVLWSPIGNKVIEVVESGTGRSKGSLLDAVDRAFDAGYAYDDMDEDE